MKHGSFMLNEYLLWSFSVLSYNIPPMYFALLILQECDVKSVQLLGDSASGQNTMKCHFCGSQYYGRG